MRDRLRIELAPSRGVANIAAVALVAVWSGACTNPFPPTDKGRVRTSVVDERGDGISGITVSIPLCDRFKDLIVNGLTDASGTHLDSLVEVGSTPVTVTPTAAFVATGGDPLTKTVQVVRDQTADVRFVLRRL